MEKFSCCNTNDERIELPPGFRFHPTDEELITHYLSPKVVDGSYTTKAIGDVDLNKVEPWDLPWKAKMGEKEWYFFCVRDRKYPTGLRTNRATEAGYWKATGKDKEIFRDKFLVGMKKTLVFYRGRAPRGEKTNWVMHEYRLEGKHSTQNLPKTSNNEWAICRIFKKSTDGKIVDISGLTRITNCGFDSGDSDLPQLMDFSSDENYMRASTALAAEGSHVTCFSNPMEDPRDTAFEDFTPSSSSRFPYFYPQNLVFVNRVQEESMLRRLADNNNAPNMKQNAKSEFSPAAMSYHEVGYLPYQDQEFPIISTAPVDLDCLWNY